MRHFFSRTRSGLWLLGCNTNPITFKIINLCTYQKAKANENTRNENGAHTTLTHTHTPTHTHTLQSHLLYQLLIDSMGNFRMSHDGDKGGCGLLLEDERSKVGVKAKRVSRVVCRSIVLIPVKKMYHTQGVL